MKIYWIIALTLIKEPHSTIFTTSLNIYEAFWDSVGKSSAFLPEHKSGFIENIKFYLMLSNKISDKEITLYYTYGCEK